MIRFLLALLGFAAQAGLAEEPRLNVALHLVPEYHDLADDGPFWLPEDAAVLPVRRSRREIEMGLSWRGLVALATLRSEVVHGHGAETAAVLNELYWDGEWFGQDLTIGRKVRSFGVGFGYRPLDLLQREDRRRLYPDALEGVTALAWHTYGAADAWSLIYANPASGEDPGQERDDESFMLKYYRLLGDTDLHAVARLSERHRLEIGAGVARAIGDHWETHASLLYQRRGERPLNPPAGTPGLPLAGADPMLAASVEPAVKALVGASWTSADGWTLLAEAWHDGTAYDTGRWRELAELAKGRSVLLGVPGVPSAAVYANIAASTRAFDRDNLLRWNTLLRLSYDGERLDPSFEFLFTPEDGGYVATFNADYRLERHRLRLSLRTYGGPPDAAYRMLSEHRVVQFVWEWVLL